MNSKELREEITKLENEMKELLSHDGFRQLIANMNFLQGGLQMARNLLTKAEAKEKVKEEADKAV